MKIISIFNQAGGVGKTTLTMNLGYHLADLGHRVLLIDLDPQSSLTEFMLGQEAESVHETIEASITDDAPLAIMEKIHGMDLIPANINLSYAERQMTRLPFSELRLKQALQPAADTYDFVVIDCPPSLGELSYNALVACTHVLIPIETQYKAYLGTDKLLATISEVRQAGNRTLKIAGFVPSKYDRRTSQDERYLAAIKENLSQVATIFPVIPRAIDFANAAEASQPLAVYNAHHPALEILRDIAKKVENL